MSKDRLVVFNPRRLRLALELSPPRRGASWRQLIAHLNRVEELLICCAIHLRRTQQEMRHFRYPERRCRGYDTQIYQERYDELRKERKALLQRLEQKLYT
jgi:hypothetical protein